MLSLYNIMIKKGAVVIPIIITSIILIGFLGVGFIIDGEVTKQYKNFTIIVLPDTQKYSQNYPEIFLTQTQWIANNQDILNIEFVIHEGDIVDDSDEVEQWEVADESMSILDENNVPYSVIRGNHDKGTELYKAYFPVKRFSDKEWWGGEYRNNTNNYHLLTIQDIDLMFINLDFCPSEKEIQWGNSILEQYSDRKAILTTHAYLDKDAGRTPHSCESTQYIWDDLIKKHANLQIVLSGHVHGEEKRTDLNEAGKPVYQMLADFQDEENGGNGFLRILEFSALEDKIYVKTYSPYT